MKKVLTGVCMFLIAMSSYAQSNDCSKCASSENDHTKVIRVPKSYDGKIPVTIKISEALEIGSPNQMRQDGLPMRYAQKRFLGLYYAGDALTEIFGEQVMQKHNYDFDIAALHGKKLRFFTAINGMWFGNAPFYIKKENCYVDVSVLNNTVRAYGESDDGLCRITMDFIFDRSCEE